MLSRVPDVVLPVVYVHALVNPMPYDAFAQYFLSIVWREYQEECRLLIDRRNPMLQAYLERFAAEEAYAHEYVDETNCEIIGKADLYVLLTTADDQESLQRLRTLRANGIRTVVIIQ